MSLPDTLPALMSKDDMYALGLSTFAGLSTAIGGALAVMRKPDDGQLAFLLGIATGVMVTLSLVELYFLNAIQHGFVGTTLSMLGGALLYYLLQPYFPEFDSTELLAADGAELGKASGPWGGEAAGGVSSMLCNCSDQDTAGAEAHVTDLPPPAAATAAAAAAAAAAKPKHWSAAAAGMQVDVQAGPPGPAADVAASGKSAEQTRTAEWQLLGGPVKAAALQRRMLMPLTPRRGSGSGERAREATPAAAAEAAAAEAAAAAAFGKQGGGPPWSSAAGAHRRRRGVSTAELLRLGMVMAMTMTLHNLPEGFAVAFSASTNLGVVMTLAIAVHNIPEGVIVAAPIFAATGSRLKAVSLALASGLSEPLGAVLALSLIKPFLTEARLQLLLAFVGGLMLSVCVIELWPEGKKCQADAALLRGTVLGGCVMLWTLWLGS